MDYLLASRKNGDLPELGPDDCLLSRELGRCEISSNLLPLSKLGVSSEGTTQ